jgi:hypothetical protein
MRQEAGEKPALPPQLYTVTTPTSYATDRLISGWEGVGGG